MLRNLLILVVLIVSVCRIVSAQNSSVGQIIPEGTVIQLSLREPLSSKLNEPGDEVIATVKRDVVLDGYTLLHQGTEVLGRVTFVQPAKRPFKGGRLHVTFDRIRVDGHEKKLTTIIQSASDFARDEKIKSDSEGTLKGGKDGTQLLENIGYGAMIGGIGATIVILSSAESRGVGGIGGVGIGGGSSAAGAAVLGGSVVTGMLLTKGKEVRLDENSIIKLRLERPLAVE